jgi:hypothetical protein
MSIVSKTSPTAPASLLPQPLNNTTHLSNFKLTQGNYTLYNTLVVHYLEDQFVFRYVTSDTPCPPQFITSLDVGNSTLALERMFAARLKPLLIPLQELMNPIKILS